MTLSVLEKIGFTIQNGLVLCSALQGGEQIYDAEILSLKDACNLGAKAVFFRRYYRENEDKPYKSEPAVYIFQENDTFFNSEKNISLHAKLWSAGRAEVYIILGQTRIDIINARRPAEVVTSTKSLDVTNLKLNLNEIKDAITQFEDYRFSAHLFAKGTFWEQSEFQSNLQEKYNPYIHLLDYLMLVRKKLTESRTSQTMRHTTVNKLLVLSILIKFLEEIKDDDERHTLKDIYKQQNVDNLVESLQEGKLIPILKALASEFNGKIFEINEQEENEIRSNSLSLIADFLSAEVDIVTKQMFLWKQYDFKYLPAEVISAIYENFIQEENLREKNQTEKGVVYTPIHLVNLLIDEVMPLDKAKEYFENESFKILDPSCGSGIFLVAAFKRMLQWWAINNSTPSNIQYPKAKEAQRIMENNIFGVDIHPTATLVSIFGLTTALLEKLTPQQIWNRLKFNDLTQNIQTNNFFEWAVSAPKDFDLVIGNPPFNVPDGENKSDILAKAKKLNLKHVHPQLPKNLALHFFEAAMTLGKKVCMIIPSNVLLYSKNSQEYRKAIFTDWNVQKIYDFTHLRESLFIKKKLKGSENAKKTGRIPVVAICVENQPSEQNSIEHIVVKQMQSDKNKTRFEIDYYDKHFVPWDWAIDEKKSFIWKCNLLGGGRLFHLIYRLSLLRNLDGFIKEKRRENNEWIYSTGYKVGGNTKKREALFVEDGDKIESIDENGSYRIAKEGESTNLFEFFPNERIYTAPFLVIDQILGKKNIPLSFIEEYKPKKYLYFNRDFIGIHAPKHEVEVLRKMYKYIQGDNRGLYQLFALANSGSAMVLTETEINKRDIDILPFPENEEYLHLSLSEEIIQYDVLNFYRHLGKAISKGGEFFIQKADEDILKGYGKAFCELINSAHAENDMTWQIGKVAKTPDETFIAYQFIFGEEKKGDEFVVAETTLEDLYQEFAIITNNDNENQGAVFQRILCWYGNTEDYDYVVFIKPNAKRYWLKSIALRDADDVIYDYFQEGY